MYDADGVVEDILIVFQVLLVPPIIYENSLTLLKRMNVLQRLGTAVVHTILGILTSIVCVIIIDFVLSLIMETSLNKL